MSVVERHRVAMRDYERLCAMYDASGADDITGSWLADEKLFDLMRNPSKKNAAYLYESLIDRIYQFGFENNISWDSSCEETMEIFERHGCTNLCIIR